MKTLLQFIADLNGKGNIGNTPENKGECVGLAFAWILNLGQSHFYGHAKDLYANAPSSEYTKIKNSPDVYPIAGDIPVWDKSVGGGFGHIAVVIGSNKADDSFTVIEQNNPLNAPCRVHTYTNWKGVIGWLRPKNLPTDTTEALEAKIEELRVQREEYRKEISILQDNIKKCAEAKEKFALDAKIASATLIEREDQHKKKIEEFNQIIHSKTKAVEELEYELSGLSQAFSKLKNELESLKAEKQAKLCDYSLRELIRALFSCR